MAVGITTFIEHKLAAGTRPPSGSSRTSVRKEGLSIGRDTDMLVRRAFAKVTRLSSGVKSHRRAIEFFRVMAAANMTLSDVQVPTTVASLNLRTTVDCMATDAGNRRVVVELKTTQHTMATHAKWYHETVRKKPNLTNGLPNSLYWRHQLQAGFGMIGTAAPRGVVVVVCSDGAVLYEVDQAVLKHELFEGAVPNIQKLRAPTIPWPADDAPLKTMRAYTRVVSRNPTILAGKHGEAVVILVHKHKSYATSRTAKNHVKVIKELARRRHVAGIVVWLDNKKWRSQTVARRPCISGALAHAHIHHE